MSLDCHRACPGKIKAPRGKGRRSGWFYEGDEVACPKCGSKYTVAFTDDFASESRPYLVAEEAP